MEPPGTRGHVSDSHRWEGTGGVHGGGGWGDENGGGGEGVRHARACARFGDGVIHRKLGYDMQGCEHDGGPNKAEGV